MRDRLQTAFLGLELSSPLVLPAGIMGISASSLEIISQNGAGLVTTKSLTSEPRSGHPGPVTARFEGGLLNCMGLCNPGIGEGLGEADLYREKTGRPVIVSLFASSAREFSHLALRVNDSRGDLLELNLSCPNVADEFGVPLAASPRAVSEMVGAVKKVSRLPVIAKLSPNVPDIRVIARAAEEAGADALCLINTLGPGMLIDIRTRRPVLSNLYGGLSGPCVKPVALRLVHQAYSTVSIPVIGMGGIATGEDAVEMLMAGAALVGVGTAVMDRGLEVFDSINREILAFMDEQNFPRISDIPKLEKHT